MNPEKFVGLPSPSKNGFNSGKIPGVIMCGGSGTRLWPLTLKKQKAMIPVLGKPIIFHLIEFWKGLCDRFIFVVKHAKEELIEYLKSLPIHSEFVEPVELRGIADGLYSARSLLPVSPRGDKFIAILGDCLCKGNFHFPEGLSQGVGVRHTDNVEEIKLSYSIETNPSTGLISRVVEKPGILPNDLCGLGFYFFDGRVFEYIKSTPPSALRNEVEITDVIENMIKGGEPISPVMFSGQYLNVTFPGDLEKAAKILSADGIS